MSELYLVTQPWPATDWQIFLQVVPSVVNLDNFEWFQPEADQRCHAVLTPLHQGKIMTKHAVSTSPRSTTKIIYISITFKVLPEHTTPFGSLIAIFPQWLAIPKKNNSLKGCWSYSPFPLHMWWVWAGGPWRRRWPSGWGATRWTWASALCTRSPGDMCTDSCTSSEHITTCYNIVTLQNKKIFLKIFSFISTKHAMQSCQ